MKALFIITPILLVGGIIGAGFMGIVPIPGITPKKAEAKANALYTEGAEQPATEQEPSVEEEKIEPPAGATKTGIDTPIQDPSMQPKTESPTVTVTTQHASEPARDPVKGAKALAKYWDEIEVP